LRLSREEPERKNWRKVIIKIKLTQGRYDVKLYIRWGWGKIPEKVGRKRVEFSAKERD